MGSRYSSSSGRRLFRVARWIDELRLDDESFIDVAATRLLRSRQSSMSSYVSPEFPTTPKVPRIPTRDGASCSSVDWEISSYRLFSSSERYDASPLFCTEPPLLLCCDAEDCGIGGSGRARLKNLLARFSLNSFILSSSVP